MSLHSISFSAALLCLFGLIQASAQNMSGFRSHQIYSSYQKDSTTVRILLPDQFDRNTKHKVLYVLPVREQGNRKNGDGLYEVYKADIHNRFDLICVAPEFTSPPWYADHPWDKTRMDESYFLKDVLPFVDANYPTVTSNQGRLLVGFSKSGWGALTLLLRNPEIFHKAAGWDIGIRIDAGPIEEQERNDKIKSLFGNEKTFEKYRLSSLLKLKGKQLGNKPRILYYNTGGKRAKGGAITHKLMVDMEIPHLYIFESKREHRWDSGWLPVAIDFLVKN